MLPALPAILLGSMTAKGNGGSDVELSVLPAVNVISETLLQYCMVAQHSSDSGAIIPDQHQCSIVAE